MNPDVTKADVSKARQALASIIDAEQRLNECKACEIPCDEEDERCKFQKKFLTNFLTLFGDQFPARNK